MMPLRSCRTILTRFKHIDAVWASDDDMAVGVLKAIEQAKRDDIKIVLGGAGAKGMIKTLMDGNNPLIQAECDLFAEDDLRRDQAHGRGPAERREIAANLHHSFRADHQGKRERLLLPGFAVLILFAAAVGRAVSCLESS